MLNKAILLLTVCLLTALIPVFSVPIADWQQKVDYEISVRLDDDMNELSGEVSINYQNNSPDDLNEIYIHTWPNAYSSDETAFAEQKFEDGSLDFYHSEKSQKGNMRDLNFKVGEEYVVWESVEADYGKIILNSPLKSGASIVINTPFKVKIPDSYSRMGHQDQAYQITQWYPKAALYDDEGWHAYSYLDLGEYYNNFGDYSVRITLPDNYTVGATGILQTESEIERLDKLSQLRINLSEAINPEEYMISSEIASSDRFKTLHYVQENVTDFAWFADKSFIVRRGSVTLDSGREIATWAMFPYDKESHLWREGITYINDGLKHYSKYVGEYPYDVYTAVKGALKAGGGMEYPTVTVIGNARNARTLERVIVHEAGHSWFQAIIATDERRYPWMDEGINSYYENRYFEEKYPGEELFKNAPPVACRALGLCGVKHHITSELTYKLSTSKYEDQAINVHSEESGTLNYGVIIYAKAAAAFKYLATSLGQSDFDNIMRSYYKKFSFKHPGPDDINAHFNSESNKYLDWFFDDVIGTTKKLDYKLKRILSDNKTIGNESYTQLLVKNSGDINGPFPISAIKDGEVVHTQWYNGFHGESEVLFPVMDADLYKIDEGNVTLESNRQNNTYKTKGLFKSLEPIRIQPLATLSTGDNTLINVLPTAHYNYYDGFGLGLQIHSGLYPFRNLEFSARPMIGLRSKEFIGTGHLAYWLHPKAGPFQHIKLSLDAESFNHAQARSFDLSDPDISPKPLVLDEPWRYNRFVPEISFSFRNKRFRSTKSNELSIRHINVQKESFNEYSDNPDYTVPGLTIDASYYVNSIELEHRDRRKINPYSISLNLYQSSKFVESTLELKNKFSYGKKNKGLHLRLFADVLPYRDTSDGIIDSKSLINPNNEGRYDYLLDDYYLARNGTDSGENRGWMNNQIGTTGLGFKALFPAQLIDKWAVNASMEADIPKVPLRLYGDFMFFDKAEGTTLYETPLAYTVGISLNLFNDILRVNLPITSDAEIKGLNELNQRTYWEQITFSFDPRKLGKWSDIRNIIQL